LVWTISGHISPDDKAASDYRLLAFEVPPGLSGLTVSYEYSKAVSAALPAGSGNVLDIGCFDPRGCQLLRGEGFRGWSGSERRTFTITPTEATPGYLAGPIYPGTWHILLGLYRILPAGCDYRLTIVGQPGEEPPAPEPGPPASPVLSRETRWYRGDLQTHTHHSDGKGSLADLAAVARARKLDFVAVTEHNTVSHLPYLAQVGGDDLLLIPAEEITTYYGHANAWGIHGWQEFRCRDDATMARIMDAVHASGGLVSVNHPKDNGPAWEYGLDLPFDCVEVWQGAWASNNYQSLAFWSELLKRGRRVVAVGGSDKHVGSLTAEPQTDDLGRPTTWVHARELSTAGILAGIRAGHVFISADPQGPELYLTADLNGDEVMMGDRVTLAAGSSLCLHARVIGGRGGVLRLISDNGMGQVPVESDDFVHQWQVRPKDDAFYRLELVEPGACAPTVLTRQALSNPIYVTIARSR